MLIDMHRRRFGERIPLIRREHVNGFPDAPARLAAPEPVARRHAPRRPRRWRSRPTVSMSRRQSAPRTPRRGNCWANWRWPNRGMRTSPACWPKSIRRKTSATKEDETAYRQFLLTYVQPGLAGLMDGSVSTLAPIFAAAFATQDTWQTFLVGLSASVGAGISMGFTEAAHDDGKLSGRGSPVKRGLACGIMTALGGLGPRPALSHPAFLDGDDHRRRSSSSSNSGRSPSSRTVHGNAVPACRFPGGARRRPGAGSGRVDRQCVTRRAAVRAVVLSPDEVAETLYLLCRARPGGELAVVTFP